MLDATLDAAGMPEAVQRRLLEMWREPHRSYHGISHLETGLDALATLEAGQLERIAFWCHNAVYTGTSPQDAYASVDVAEQLLWGHLRDAELEEVTRLILVTVRHLPAAGDVAGARVSDADFVSLTLDWDAYLECVDGLRSELPQLSGRQWRQYRSAQIEALLAREHLFCTDFARTYWEDRARVNLLREFDELC